MDYFAGRMVPPDGDFRLMPVLTLSAALIGSCKPTPPLSEAPVQIAAAADLTHVFEELGELFEQRTGRKVSFSFAASGVLAKQLSQGAPFDLFAAADSSFVDHAVQSGACEAATKARYGYGHVVVWTKKGSAHVERLADLRRPEVRHIAIANPTSAPYGRAAREVLQSSGLLPALEGKLVQAENVRQALQFAQTGNADAAIVALSLVATDETGLRLAVPSSLHRPISQTLVVCKHGKNRSGAHAFAALVASAEGQSALRRHGLSGSANEPTQ
jgi:molybdate transport system substrate-binding protein